MLVTPFARRVKGRRAAQGLTVRDLAAALGKSVAYIAKIETQGVIPTPELTCEIARVLNADAVELLELAKAARLTSLSRDVERDYNRAIAGIRVTVDAVRQAHMKAGE